MCRISGTFRSGRYVTLVVANGKYEIQSQEHTVAVELDYIPRGV